MRFSNTAFVWLLSCVMGGCVADDAAETAVEQGIYHNEVRVRQIAAEALEEGGDEIYMNASQSSGGSVNIIRPDADPDYWRFDTPDTCHTMDLHVGTIVSGSLLIVNLWEQDGGADDEIGTIDFMLSNTGVPKTFNTPTGKFLGMDGGQFVVRFTNHASYKVWFQVGP